MTQTTQILDFSLNQSDRIQQFREGYYKASHRLVALDYLKNSEVRTFTSKGKVVAGYVRASGQQLRLFDAIPEHRRTESLAAHHLTNENSAEITCVWIDKNHRSVAMKVALFTRLIFDSMTCGKENILGGAVIEKMAIRQSKVMPHMIYEGTLVHDNKPEYGYIYFAKTKEIGKTYARIFIGELKKEIRKAF